MSYNSIDVIDLLEVVVFVATAAAVPPPPPPSTEATPAPVLPGNLKNDGSFLEQFKKMQRQKSQQNSQTGIIVMACLYVT